MAEPDFEAQLTRLFAEAPSFPDATLFNAEVAAKLDRGWTVRRMFIGLAGTAAGLFAAPAGQVVRLFAALEDKQRAAGGDAAPADSGEAAE